MSKLLALDEVKQRIEALIIVRNMKREAVLPLIHIFGLGPVTRSEFARMTGLKERTARSLLSKLLADRLLVSETPYGPLRFELPLDALNLLFPNLYPEAALPISDLD